MATRAAPSRRSPSRRPSAARRRAARRRRWLALALAGLAAVGLAMAAFSGGVQDAAQEIVLPLKHEDIIRQQAREKDLDPALVAGVIFVESRFSDATSPAGARGLMQITPQTAQAIAQRSGGTAFEQGDLSNPQINIAYGTYYLRLLLDKYEGDELNALAAYNAGQGNVDRWGLLESTDEIPFPETRAYVDKVLEARDDYRRTYARELGL